MSDAPRHDALRDDRLRLPPSMTPRHGLPWEEEDFAEIMRGCREGCDLEEIAARIGRKETNLKQQLRRLLPGDERHLAGELVLPRLRQLDQGGDYDWLAAMAEREVPRWELERAAAPPPRGAIETSTDEELLALAVALLASTPVGAPLRAIRERLCARSLADALRHRARQATDDAVDALLGDGDAWPAEQYPFARASFGASGLASGDQPC